MGRILPAVRQVIRPGVRFTGRKLIEAIEASVPDIRGGNGIEVKEGQNRFVISATATQARVPAGATFFPAIISTVTVQTANQWRYGWDEAEVVNFGVFGILANGRSSTDGDQFEARNIAEVTNTATIVLRGLDLNADPTITITLQPIPVGSVVWMRELPNPLPLGGNQSYFDAPNTITVSCVAPAQGNTGSRQPVLAPQSFPEQEIILP